MSGVVWTSMQCLTLEQHEDCPRTALFPIDGGAQELSCACGCHPGNVPQPEPVPTDLVTLRAEVAKATTVAGLRSAVLGVVDAMGDSPVA